MFETSELSRSAYTRVVLIVTVLAGLTAAIAAAPSASVGKETNPATVTRSGAQGSETGRRPLAPGPAMRVGRAFDANDEDCVLVVTRTPDADGQIRVKRMVSCAN
jgi:hypothetical protein